MVRWTTRTPFIYRLKPAVPAKTSPTVAVHTGRERADLGPGVTQQDRLLYLGHRRRCFARRFRARQVILLDRVQKKQPIEREDYLRLKSAGLVEGRYPSVMVSARVARATGDVGRHIRERGFNKQYYVDLILALLQEHGPVGRKEVDEVLVPKLPDRMSNEQKRIKTHNLLSELRRSGRIVKEGTRAEPRWVVVRPVPKGNPL